jgi:hypothetical protein
MQDTLSGHFTQVYRDTVDSGNVLGACAEQVAKSTVTPNSPSLCLPRTPFVRSTLAQCRYERTAYVALSNDSNERSAAELPSLR